MFLFRDFTLETNREIHSALRQIYGIGWRKSRIVLAKVGIGYPFYLNKINSYNFSFLSSFLKLMIISDVRIKRRVEFDIARITGFNSVKGLRHKLSLPFMASAHVLMLIHNVRNVISGLYLLQKMSHIKNVNNLCVS